VNTILANATNGLDFGSYDTSGHYIRDFQAAALNNAVYVSKSSSGFLADIGTVSTFWLDINKNQANQSLLDYPQPRGNPPEDVDPADGVIDTSVGQGADEYASGSAIILGSAKNEMLINIYLHGPHLGLKTVDDHGGPSFTLIQYGSETYTGLDIEALDPAGMTVVSTQYHTISTDCYPGNCGDVVGSPYLVVGSGVPATTPIRFFLYANHAATPVGLDLSGGKTMIYQYDTDQDGNDVTSVRSIANVHGANTGFALIGAQIINPFTGTVIASDASPNVLIAATEILPGESFTGPVTQLLVPIGADSADTSGGNKKSGGKKKGR
jgi:hypothetical protein